MLDMNQVRNILQSKLSSIGHTVSTKRQVEMSFQFDSNYSYSGEVEITSANARTFCATVTRMRSTSSYGKPGLTKRFPKRESSIVKCIEWMSSLGELGYLRYLIDHTIPLPEMRQFTDDTFVFNYDRAIKFSNISSLRVLSIVSLTGNSISTDIYKPDQKAYFHIQASYGEYNKSIQFITDGDGWLPTLNARSKVIVFPFLYDYEFNQHDKMMIGEASKVYMDSNKESENAV